MNQSCSEPPDSTSAQAAGREAALWERYRASGDESARDALIRQHVSLVHYVARQMSARAPAAEYEEMVSAGSLGLLAALAAYDPERGFAFSTFAVARIRGAILDDLRRRDWMPRSSRLRSRRLAAARGTLQAKLLRAPRPSEVARELGLELEAYWRWCDELDGSGPNAAAMSADGVVSVRGASEASEPELTASDEHAPDRRLMVEEEEARVRAAIQELPERERRVLELCYYEELTQREIGTVLGVTESRVSQLRRQALRRIEKVLQN